VKEKHPEIRLRNLGCFVAILGALVLTGCAGVSSASKQAVNGNPTGAQLAVTPMSMDFGTVAVGSNTKQAGTLTAGTSDITVSSAAWNGPGYSVSGITFPVTVPAGQSIPFTVTFAPQTAGSAPGNVSFDSNASNSPTTETWTGSGAQLSSHTVALSWNASTSQVAGYNVYRGTTPGGPYAKLNTALETSTSYTDNQLLVGQTYYYVTTSVDSTGLESQYSNQASATAP
jgi:hypothetical protein